MKAKITLAALLLALMGNGSSCINEGFIIPVNLEVGNCYAITPGASVPAAFDLTKTIPLGSLVDETYRSDLKGVRYYDIHVRTVGAYSGNVVGVVYVNGQPLLNIGTGTGGTTPAAWSMFGLRQTLLGSSPVLRTNTLGLAALTAALNQLAVDENATVTLRVVGQVSGVSPVPSGLSVCVNILAQADASLNN